MTGALSRFTRFHLPAILWALLIFISSSIPYVRLPEVRVLSVDKLLHVLVFFILAWLLHRSFRNLTVPELLRTRRLAAMVFAAALYGGLDELHQMVVPGRDASLYDLVADTAGAFLYALVFHLRERRRSMTPV